MRGAWPHQPKGIKMGNRTKIAFLGTGLMGFAMARNLLRAGHDVRVWNRSTAKAEPLVELGAIHAQTPQDAVAGVNIIVSMVSDGAAAAALAGDQEVRAALGKGAIWVDMSSTKPDEAKACARHLAAYGVRFLDAPVSGGTKGAEAATLAIMVGGDIVDFAAVVPVFNAMGRAVHVGPVGAGQLAKLANQAIVAITIGAVAEATLLLEKGGADPGAVREALKGGFADSTILQQHGQRMSARDFTPGGPSYIQLKDLDNVLAEAQASGLTLPMVASVRDRYARYVTDLEGAGRDHAGLFEELLDLNAQS